MLHICTEHIHFKLYALVKRKEKKKTFKIVQTVPNNIPLTVYMMQNVGRMGAGLMLSVSWVLASHGVSILLH